MNVPSGDPAAGRRNVSIGAVYATVTFDEIAGRTLVVVHDLYPSKGALDAASGSTGAMPEALDQLDELFVSLRSTTTK
jgi:hypothetical protein